MAPTSKPDFAERVSYVSSINAVEKVDGGYVDAKTPGTLETCEGGALRAGGASSLLSREACGLFAQYAAVGVMYGTLPGTVQPFLTYYLNMEGTATASANTLITIAWSFKVFIGMLSDCLPIMGFRRRPYMVLGWTVCFAMLLIMAAMPMPVPYYKEDHLDLRGTPLDKLTQDQIDNGLNVHAADQGGKYVILMMFASLGYLMADVAADAVVVEYAQHEPIETRGRTQTAVYTVRTMFMNVSYLLLGFGMNTPEYGGDFSSGFNFRVLCWILAVFCLPVIPVTWCFIREDRFATRPHFGTYMGNFWGQLQSRAVYQVVAYNFFAGVLSNFSYVAYTPITSYWVKATPLNTNLSFIFANCITSAALVFTGKYGLHWNWRFMIATTMVAVVAIDAVTTMLTTWGVVRSQWFWLGVPLVENVPAGIQFIVSAYVVVELAGVGNEGAIYGLMTTVGNLSQPFATTLYKNVDSSFKVLNDDIMQDTHDVRRDVTYTILLSYAFKFASLAFLPLLPRQKDETQALKRDGGSSKLIGTLTLVYCAFALVWSLMTNIMSIFPSTACLKIAGGDGC